MSPVFQTDRRLLLIPALLGGALLLTNGGLLVLIALSGERRLDVHAIFISLAALAGAYFLMTAWRLGRYRLSVTEKGLGVGDSGLIPWSEVERLDRHAGRIGVLYKLTAGKREVAFSSQLFRNHADLASLISEHTGKDWTPVG